nr:hypothetical protein [uncultured Draconibacterium sp.]
MKKFNLMILLIWCYPAWISQDWFTYEDPGKAFKIEFPGEPMVIDMPAGFGMDSTRIIQYFPTEDFENAVLTTLTVMYMSEEILKPELNETSRFEVLENYAAVTLKMTGEVLESDTISLSGFPGVFIKGRITQAVNDENYPPVFIKSYLVGNTIYILKITFSPKQKDLSKMDYFFKSFELH